MEETIKATFVKDGDWWIGYSDDVPGALTQGKTLEEAKENLIDAIQLIRQPVKYLTGFLIYCFFIVFLTIFYLLSYLFPT